MDDKDPKIPLKGGYQDYDDNESACSEDVLLNDFDTIVSDETICAPPYSHGKASSKDGRLDEVDAFQGDRLLAPPSYDAHPPFYQSGNAKVDVREAIKPNETPEDDVELESNRPSRSRRGCLGRRREKRRWFQGGEDNQHRFRQGCLWRLRQRCNSQSDEPKKPRSTLQKFLVVVKASVLAWIFVQVFCLVFFGRRHSSGYWDQFGRKHPSNPSSSRETVIKESHRAVSGEFPLEDYLSINTISGTISVVIVPQPANPADPLKPARISLKSISGSVSVSFAVPTDDQKGTGVIPRPLGQEIDEEIRSDRKYGNPCAAGNGKEHFWKTFFMPKADCADDPLPSFKSNYTLPPRPYEIEIETTSGSIFAKVGFTSRAKLSSTSGSIRAHLVPLIFTNASAEDGNSYSGFNHKRVSIDTRTKSGSTLLSVTEPRFIEASKAVDDDDIEEDAVSTDSDTDTDLGINRYKEETEEEEDEGEDEDEDDGDDEVTIMKRGRHSFRRVRAKARHATHSGGLSVSYPQSWAGLVYATNGRRGKASVVGKGFDSINRRGGAVKGIKRPARDNEKEWWGSQGNMRVRLAGGGTGRVEFEL